MKKRQSQVRAFRMVLRRFERAQKSQIDEQDSCCGLSFAQCHPLLEIHELGETTAGDLTRRLNLDKSTLSRVIDGLVKQGLVRRATREDDRRFQMLTLTSEGIALCEEINRKNDLYYEQVLARLPESDREEAIRLLDVLARAMSDASGVLETCCPSGRSTSACCGTSKPDPENRASEAGKE